MYWEVWRAEARPLRRLLNVESGLNDGLALPFVLIFLATVKGQESDLGKVGIELALGLALGLAIPAAVALAWRLKFLTAEPRLQALGPLAIGSRCSPHAT